MSQVAAYRDKRQVVPTPYAPGGCPVKFNDEKCGEIQGLDIIKDFHQLYQQKMSEIDVSAGGDNLQEKVDLQQKWINDLTEQNKMLAKVIEELEREAIGRLQQLENKLKNAAKSFGEEDLQALADKDRKIKELEEALKAQPVARSDSNDMRKENDRKRKQNDEFSAGKDRGNDEPELSSKKLSSMTDGSKKTKEPKDLQEQDTGTQQTGTDRLSEEYVFVSKDMTIDDSTVDKQHLDGNDRRSKELPTKEMPPTDENLKERDRDNARSGQENEQPMDENDRKSKELATKEIPPTTENLESMNTENDRSEQGGAESSAEKDRKKDEIEKEADELVKTIYDSNRENEENGLSKQVEEAPSDTQKDKKFNLPLCPVKKDRPCSPESCKKAKRKPTDPISSIKNYSPEYPPNQEELPSRSDNEQNEKTIPPICPVKKDRPCSPENCMKTPGQSTEPTSGILTTAIVVSDSSEGQSTTVSAAKQETSSKLKLGGETLDKKSVHLLLEGYEEKVIVEPEKDHDQQSLDIAIPRIDSIPVIGIQDSLEYLKAVRSRSQNSERSSLGDISQKNACVCENKTFVNEFLNLKEENKMLREGEEITRLRNELDEKLKRILELNEENRTLNDMVNALKSNQDTVRLVAEVSDSDPMSSDSEYNRSTSLRREDICKYKCCYDNREKQEFNHLTKGICACREFTLPQAHGKSGNANGLFIDVYQRKGKEKFGSDSTSTICNEEICPFVVGKYASMGNYSRARGGNDNIMQSPAEQFPIDNNTKMMDECTDYNCPNKDMATDTSEKDVIVICAEKKEIKCSNKICQTECNDFEPTFIYSTDTLLSVNADNSMRYDTKCTKTYDSARSAVQESTFPEGSKDETSQIPESSIKEKTDKNVEARALDSPPLPETCDSDTCQVKECTEPGVVITSSVPEKVEYGPHISNEENKAPMTSNMDTEISMRTENPPTEGEGDVAASHENAPPNISTDDAKGNISTIKKQNSTSQTLPTSEKDLECMPDICGTCPSETVVEIVNEEKCDEGIDVKPPVTDATTSAQVMPPGSEPGSVKQHVSTTSSAYGSDLPTEEEMKTEPLTGEHKDTFEEIPTESTKSTDKDIPASEGMSPDAITPDKQQGRSEKKKHLTADKSCQEPCVCTPDEETAFYLGRDESKPQPRSGVSEIADAEGSPKPSPIQDSLADRPETETKEKIPVVLTEGVKPPTIISEEPSTNVDEKHLVEEQQKTEGDEEKPSTIIGDITSTPENEVPQSISGKKSPTILTENDDKPTGADEKLPAESTQEPSNIATEQQPTISKDNDDILTTADDKPPAETDKEPPNIATEQLATISKDNDDIPTTTDDKPPAEADEDPSNMASEKPLPVTEGVPSTQISETPPVAIDAMPTARAAIDELPEEITDIPTEMECKNKICDFTPPEKDKVVTATLSDPGDKSDKVVIRCICKSKFCKIVPDPDNPKQKLCVDVSTTNLEPDGDSVCICAPNCPKKDAFAQNSGTDIAKEDKEQRSALDTPQESNHPIDEMKKVSINPKNALVYTFSPLTETGKRYGTIRYSFSDIGQPFKDHPLKNLSKEQEYAGLSRKEADSWKNTKYIPPRKAASTYGIQEDATDTSDLKDVDETKHADLKIVIADLKNKLLDAEDKIEELKNIKTFGSKDNNMALISRYSEEIEHLKKSLKWTSKEKEEYEYLKRKVKLLEQGKGDTDNITSNLQTAEDKSILKVQLKKLSKKNKCYEEIVQFFKEEMSVMSDELLTLQEVLNVTNVSSQEENTKLINAILQLRRINDRLVSHLCEIEKQVVLENQINQINETRINELQNIIGSKNNDLNQHDQTIQEMRRKLSNATKQNADLKKTIKNLTDAVVEIQEGIKSVERDHNRNKNDVSVVESKVCLADGNLKDIKVCIEQKNNTILDLENQLKSQEVSIILATKELEVIKEKKADYKKLIISLKEQLASYEKRNEEMMGDYHLVSNQLQDYTNLDHMKNYELNHYKGLVEEMKMSLMQMNYGLEKCEASNIHFYEEDIKYSDMSCDKNGTSSGVFKDLRKSMADMKQRLSDAEFKGGLIEEELLKVKESHMSQIREEVTESQKDLETKILASIEEQAKLNLLVEQQKEEIEELKKELEKEKLESCSYKRSVSELKNEKMGSNAQMEILHLKCELNKSLQRQRLLNEENDKIHSKMISLRKKLSTIEQAYEVMKQENEEYKIQLKKTLREKEYITHKNQELTKNIEDMRSSHDQLERQCRSMMKRMSQEKSWIKKPMQQPFSPRRYSPQSDRRSSTPTRNRRSERPMPDVRYRSVSPWRSSSGYPQVDSLDEDEHSHKTNMTRNISYDSNPSPYTSRSPSPQSDYFQGEVEMNNMNLNDWFSPNFKEADTDADEGDDDLFINKLHVLTAQVQEANKRWQQKMNTNSVSTSRAKNSNV